MKLNIHPQYNDAIRVSCACGNSFQAGSTLPELKVELCSACHPFYTGKQKLLDTARRVEKFQDKLKASEIDLKKHKNKKEKRTDRDAKKIVEISKKTIVDLKKEKVGAKK